MHWNPLMILTWFAQEQFCNLQLGFNLANTLEKTTKTNLRGLSVEDRDGREDLNSLLSTQISSIWVLLISINDKIMFPQCQINSSRHFTFYYGLYTYIQIYVHIYMYVYTHTLYFTPRAVHWNITCSHSRYIRKDVSNKLICKHAETEGAEGERDEKKSSKRGKQAKCLITFKLCCQNRGVINGFSWKDVPDKPSWKPYCDHTDSSETLITAHLFLKEESQVSINSRNTPPPPHFPSHSQWQEDACCLQKQRPTVPAPALAPPDPQSWVRKSLR